MSNCISVYSKTANNSQMIMLLFSMNGRAFTMCRIASECVEQTLKRIGISVRKASKVKQLDVKGKKGKEQESANDIPVSLCWADGEVVDAKLSNSLVWKEGNILTIGESTFHVEENTPMVHSARISSVIMAGYPVVPVVKLEFADEVISEYRWLKSVVDHRMSAQSESTNQSEEDWVEVGQEFIYTPSVSDIDSWLKMSCKAASVNKVAHKWFDVTAALPVAAGPGVTPIDARHLYIAGPKSDIGVFRVVSYNVLADCYLEDDAVCEAWFGYCPRYALAIDYRQQLLLKEIVGYHSDIICLQECSRRFYDDYLYPMMSRQGYSGFVKYKGGVMPEGEALFFNKSKFSLISQEAFVLKDALIDDKELLWKVQAIPEVNEKLTSRTTIAQIAVIQQIECPCNYICVVNTHLYFRPNAAFIRNLQTMILLNILKKTIDKLGADLKTKHGDAYRVGVVFSGDFNSLPASGVVQLMSSGILPSDHSDWSLPSENPGRDHVDMSSFMHKFDFQNCCGFPEFTTYTQGFSGVIDYIFASKECFKVESVVPVPTKDEVQLYTAIPSPVMPSDHVALVCELKWK